MAICISDLVSMNHYSKEKKYESGQEPLDTFFKPTSFVLCDPRVTLIS